MTKDQRDRIRTALRLVRLAERRLAQAHRLLDAALEVEA